MEQITYGVEVRAEQGAPWLQAEVDEMKRDVKRALSRVSKKCSIAMVGLRLATVPAARRRVALG
jgi:hypothetical protein